jgi:hypothetical protein
MVKSKSFTISMIGIFFICLLFFSLFPKGVNASYDVDILKQNQIVTQEKSDLINFLPISYENTPQRYIVFGSGPISDIMSNAKNMIYGVSTNHGSFAVGIFQENDISSLKLKGYNVIEDLPLEFDSVKSDISIFHDATRVEQILGADKVIQKYNYTGAGIKIGIVDQGTDFSNPDMQGSVARDNNNVPIMIDADGQGLVLTNATFIANINDQGFIRNYTHPIPKNITSSVYVTSNGIFLNLNQGGKGTDLHVFNSNYPKGGIPVLDGIVGNDYKIGKDPRHFIVSKSGVYHFGIIYESVTQGQISRLQLVPVLVVDSQTSGIYDTIIPDMSDSWKDFTKFDNPLIPQYDFDFTDETPITLGDGKEFLVYDSHHKNNPDYSAGTVGARVLDIYGIMSNASKIDKKLGAINGTLLPPLDKKGNFFGVMYDFGGHGTATAASITSQGKQLYNIYNNGTNYIINGIAPGAKIVPIKALWLGDALYGWLWAAGFDQDKNYWKFSGAPRVDILSNSWGISTFPALQTVPGFDIQSLLLGALDVPESLDKKYPGILVVNSAGNAGPGYGTMGSPDAAPFSLTVGAATDNVYLGYGPFKGQPRFGNSTLYYGDVSGFSSKGPSIIGDPKPDLMAVGEYAFTPTSVTKFNKASTGPFSLFGGTSLAAPLAAGSAAILMQALNEKGIHYDPFMIKNILMSSTSDLYNDPFAQGSGLINVTSAVNFVLGNDDVFAVYNNNSYSNIKRVLEPAVDSLNSSSVGLKMFQLPNNSLPETSWFAGRLNPGDRAFTTFTIENPTNHTIEVQVLPQTINLIKISQYNGTTDPRLQDPSLKNSGIYRPDYIPLVEVTNHTNLLSYFKEGQPIPSDSSLMVLDITFPFSEFMNSTAKTYADDLKISSLYLYDWDSKNKQNTPTYKELSLINRGGAWGTVQQLRISEPNSKIKHVPLVGIYPVPTRYSYWSGDTKKNSTSIDYALTASYFKKANWNDVWTSSKMMEIQPHSSTTAAATLIVSADQKPGVYQGFITFKGKLHTVNAPVSYVVLKKVQPKDLPTVILGSNGNALFGNGYVGGGFDMTNRYNTGDWREYFFDVKDKTINSVTMIISWQQPDTNLSVFMIDPQGKIIQTNVPAGILGQFQGWPTGDWLGPSTPFSEGGGFYPIKNKDATSTVLYAPINQTGVYSVLIHTTLFGGSSVTEPTTLYAKFSTILPQENAPQIMLDIPQFINSTYVIVPKIISDSIQDEKYYLDSAGPQRLNATSLSSTLAKLSEGNHDLRIVVTDTVGHVTSQDFKFFLDNTPPVIAFKSPDNGSTVSGMININLDVNDPNLMEKGWLSIKTANQTILDNNSFQFDTKSLPNGPYNIDAIAIDKAGNVAKEKITINVDNSGSIVGLQNKSDQNFITLLEILVGIAVASAISVIAFKKFKVYPTS